MAKKTSTSKKVKNLKSKKANVKKKSAAKLVKTSAKKVKKTKKAKQLKAQAVVKKKSSTNKKTAATKKINTVKKMAIKNSAPQKTPTNKSVVNKTVVKPKVQFKKVNNDLSMIVTPLDDRLFVELKHTERKTAGGLYIPDTVADVSGNLQGIVVSVGRGHLNKKGHLRPMDVHVGDQVVFSEHSGQKIEISNQEYIILREADVLGVITP